MTETSVTGIVIGLLFLFSVVVIILDSVLGGTDD